MELAKEELGDQLLFELLTDRIDLRARLIDISSTRQEAFYEAFHKLNYSRSNRGYLNWASRLQYGSLSEGQARQIDQKIAQRAYSLINETLARTDMKLPKMVLELISEPKSKEASHITLTISGFLSEETDKMEHWTGVSKYYKGHSQVDVLDASTAIYSLTWEAESNSKFYKQVAKSVTSIAINSAMTISGGPQGKLGMLVLGASSAMEIEEIRKMLIKAKKNAKIVGKMLACALALRNPFQYHSVSLIAFSLGTVVAKSCLKTLDYLYGEPQGPLLFGANHPHCDILQDVTFMGAAAQFKKNKSNWRRIITNVVNGEFKNVHSQHDLILKLYQFCCSEHFSDNPAGRKRVVLEAHDDPAKAAVVNIDISNNVVSKKLSGMGHTDYMNPFNLMELCLNIGLK